MFLLSQICLMRETLIYSFLMIKQKEENINKYKHE